MKLEEAFMMLEEAFFKERALVGKNQLSIP